MWHFERMWDLIIGRKGAQIKPDFRPVLGLLATNTVSHQIARSSRVSGDGSCSCRQGDGSQLHTFPAKAVSPQVDCGKAIFLGQFDRA